MDEDVPLLAALALALLQCVVGATVSLSTRRAADGRLARNPLVGIRTASTMRSDAAWRAGHAAAVPLADLGGTAFALGGLLALVLRTTAFPAALLGGVLVGTVLLLAAARRAVRAAAAAD
jgi:hypothetical protein